MRIKEIDRTANVAWSPASQYPIYLAAGTAAQQLDATFSTSSALEVYSLNLAEATLDMPVASSLASDVRFHKVIWGSYGMDQTSLPAGVLVAGADNGGICVYNADGLIKGQKDALILEESRHTGAVKALDFNSFQHNLLATGGSESEIFIWDLSKPESPMTPGQKSQPPEDVACVSWNKQVQHILASTFAARCVVWDLRKNEPIIKVSDSMARMKCKMVAWHPEVATQMCLSSEDDHTPVIQLWDLRYATSPLKVLENHQRGILSIAWCPQDPDLLLSCGKDNRILCWNPNSNVQGGEVIYELPTNNQWSFDVQWCPRNPSLISSSSFEGHVTVYSLMGGGHPVQPSNKVAESFNTMEPFSQAPVPVPQEEDKVMPLQKPPKWLRRPVGASFSFGGKLVSFEHVKPQKPQQPVNHQVFVSQVVTETELLSRSSQLEQALSNGQYMEFCAMKAANAADGMQENIWNFLMVNFEKEPRNRYLQLLGYDQTEVARKVIEHTYDVADPSQNHGVDAQELAQKMSLLNAGDSLNIGNLAASGQASPSVGSKTPNDSRDELSDGSAAFDEIASVEQKKTRSQTPLLIPKDNDADGLMAQALMMGNFEAAVEMCLSEDKMAEAILLSIAGGPELLMRTQKKYFQRNKSNLGRLISSVVTHDWAHIVMTCSLENWKEALAVILTYAKPDEFSSLCDNLATRLETEKGGEFSLYACLCYICSGNVEKLVENWMRNTENSNSPLVLQDMVEKIMILRKAVELSRGQAPEIPSGPLADSLSQYAGLLAAQGSLTTAIGYLGGATQSSLAVLQDRLYQALSQSVPGMQAPPFPFSRVNILPEGTPMQQPAVAAPSSQVRSGQASTLYQSQARSNFQTQVTKSTNYYSPQTGGQMQYSTMNGPSGMQTTYTPQPVVSSAPVSQKSGLSHKYPTYPQSSAAYGLDTYPMGQPVYSQPTQPNFYSGSNYSVPSQPAPVSQSNIYNPANNIGGSYSSAGGSSMPTMPSYQDVKADSAWNDPPLIKDKSSNAAQFERPAPITAPLYGAPQPPADQAPPGAPMNYSNLYNPQEYQHTPQIPMAPVSNTPIPNTEPKVAAPPPQPPQPVPKGPVPSEHKVLQDIFDNLVNNCTQVATNAQMKRKLEDVARKLEILYDRLRDSSLSQNVILGLHQIIQSIQQYDYNTSLAIYTQMVSQGNFSEISTFMPGVKMLLQMASQLQVYVQ